MLIMTWPNHDIFYISEYMKMLHTKQDSDTILTILQDIRNDSQQGIISHFIYLFLFFFIFIISYLNHQSIYSNLGTMCLSSDSNISAISWREQVNFQ
jgi:hypothetical protein